MNQNADSPRHDALAARVRELLGAQRQSIAVGAERYTADASLVQGPIELDPGGAIWNPSVLIEVISRQTEAQDRGDKWIAYRRLTSLRDYLLVSQNKMQVEHYRRRSNPREWDYAAHSEGVVTLSTGHVLDIDALYRDIELTVDQE